MTIKSTKPAAKPVAKPAAPKAKKPAPFVTENLSVEFSNLKSADVKFKNPNHNVTVVLTAELQEKLEKIAADLGASKINGLKSVTDANGNTYDTIKFKSSMSVKDGPSFPCVDSKAKPTDAFPYRGDIIRCRIAPFIVEIDGSVSFALNGVQIIEKRPYAASGFEAVDDGFVGGASEDPDAAPAEGEEETPF